MDPKFDVMDNINPLYALSSYNLTLPNKSSGPRLNLFGGFLQQYLILEKPELPRMFTGFEKELGIYNESLQLADVNYRILEKIDKYYAHPNYHYMVIVQDIDTGIIDCMEITHAETLNEDRGYLRDITDFDRAMPGETVPKGTVITKSTSHDENLNFRYGINANTMFVSDEDNIEDGIVISESFAKRVVIPSVKTVELSIGMNEVLLNSYGDDDNYKSFPEIFENIKDGVLCVKRKIPNDTFAAYTTNEALRTLNNEDEMVYATGQILDIDIFCNSNSELTRDLLNRNQLLAHYDIVRSYKERCVEAMERYPKTKNKVTTRFNVKYNSLKFYSNTCAQTVNTQLFTNGVNPGGNFEFITVKFKIADRETLTNGCKLCNRHGSKGVSCRIEKDEYMPVDGYGNRAEVILNPGSIPGRLNIGQNYEHELNFIADRVHHMIIDAKTNESKLKILIDFFKETDKDHCKFITDTYSKLTTKEKNMFWQEVEDEGLYVRQAPMDNISLDGLETLYRKFKIKPTVLTYKQKIRTEDGNWIEKEYKTINEAIIAKIYFMISKHTTDSKFSAVSIGKTNSLGLPGRASTKTRRNIPFRQTCVKLGEMEGDIMANLVGIDIINRFMASSMNKRHRQEVAEMLLTQDPHKYHDIPRPNEDIKGSIAANAFVALCHQCGYMYYTVPEKKKIANVAIV
jgi:hypothetical protein